MRGNSQKVQRILRISTGARVHAREVPRSIPGSLSVVSEARRGKAHGRARCVRALSIQRLEGSRPRFAADADPMQIQWWKGAASSCAEAVPQNATHDSMSWEAGCLRKRIVKSVVEELEKEIRSAASHRGTERVETRFRIGESRFMPQP